MAPVSACVVIFLSLLSVCRSLPLFPRQLLSLSDIFGNEYAALAAEMPTLTGLPSNTNVTLKYVAVGVGYQNYTCNGATYVQTEEGDGAVAYLYDATDYFMLNSGAIPTLPSQRLSQFEADGESQAATDFNPMLPLLGKHFFDTNLKPNFDLFAAEPPLYLLADKIDTVPSPDAGNVAWLFLLNEDMFDPSAGETEGLSTAYRVQTAGGDAPSSCTDSGATLQAAYSAEYWFFE